MLELVKSGRTPEQLAKDFEPTAQTTRRGEVGEHASDLVDRDFAAEGPDQL